MGKALRDRWRRPPQIIPLRGCKSSKVPQATHCNGKYLIIGYRKGLLPTCLAISRSKKRAHELARLMTEYLEGYSRIVVELYVTAPVPEEPPHNDGRCRHCKDRKRCRPRGLCFVCSYDPLIRARYPSTSKYGRWADG